MKKEYLDESDADDAGPEGDADPKKGDADPKKGDADAEADADADADAKPAPKKKRARRAAAEPEAAASETAAVKPRPAQKRPGPTAAATAQGAEPDVAAPGVTLAQEKAARRALTTGATLSAIGLMLVGIGPSDAGMAICLAGLIALIYGIHTYGRLGPEPAK